MGNKRTQHNKFSSLQNIKEDIPKNNNDERKKAKLYIKEIYKYLLTCAALCNVRYILI